MKKRMVMLLCATFAMFVFTAGFAGCGGAAREDTLKIYNWGEYIDPDVISMFKDWYKEETKGKTIKVVYREFEENEDILTSLNKGGDWDVVCPSDYMIANLMRRDMLQELDPAVIAEFSAKGDPMIKELIQSIDKDNKYCVPYIWGTFGIMYDSTKFNEAQTAKLDSWAALWDEEFAGKIYMKKQVRDAYTVAMLYHYREDLKAASKDFDDYEAEEYRALLDKIFQVFSDAELEKAQKELNVQKTKRLLKKYEGDEGKIEMASGLNTAGSLGMFWSCDAGFAMNDMEEEASFFSCGGSPKVVPGNKNLGYIIPKEGANLWADAWCIPKNAKNAAAANMFIKFTLQKDVAKLNSEYAGAPSANKDAFSELKAQYEADTEFFKDAGNPKFKEQYMEARFPSAKTLERCAVMADFGELFQAFNDMYDNIING
ncbi:MAG: extracellular solute-binding protein [Firmicutes bacterium]|nr:extracellular solute-binding protein [Bacillota bacterium]